MGVPHIDHNHATNRVRGLLCVRCNVALGVVESTPRWLSRTAAYLEKYAGANDQQATPEKQ